MNKREIIRNSAKTAVLIPVFNEAQTIGKVVHDFKEALPDARIYVLDNNSSDGSGDIANRFGATVLHVPRQGKGHAIRTAFREIEADCYLMVDGDDTYPAQNAKEMVEAILKKHADMVIGDRLSGTYFKENTRLFHGAGNRLVRFLINRFFHCHINDIMTGYRAFSRRFAKSFPALSDGFELETEMTIYALEKDLQILSFPIAYRNRPKGSKSKLNTFSDGVKVIGTIFKLYRNYKPFEFFGLLAFVLCTISLVLLFPVAAAYLQTGLVERFPTLIVSGFVFLSSMFSFFSGLILDTLRQKHRELTDVFLMQSMNGNGI